MRIRYFILCIFFLPVSCSGPNLKGAKVETVEKEYKYPVKIQERYEYSMNYIKCERVTGERLVEKEKINIYTREGREIFRKTVSIEKKKEPVDFVLEKNDKGLVVKVHDLGKLSASTLTATMYYPGDPLCWKDGTETFLGYKMQRGMVAIDPCVYKLKSKFFIPHYGIGFATDTGSAIKGKRIDLGVISGKEADRFGIRKVKVFLLKD